MEMSVREARAQFASALAAAERGERVTITRNGKPIAELGPLSEPAPAKKRGWTLADLDRIQAELGIPKPDHPLDDKWLRDFNSPKWTEELFGPEYREAAPRHAHHRVDGHGPGTSVGDGTSRPCRP